jgi:hypothetical protein
MDKIYKTQKTTKKSNTDITQKTTKKSNTDITQKTTKKSNTDITQKLGVNPDVHEVI